MKIKYRPEIDGLRAIAVFAVIFYHIKLPFLSPFFRGGFIGVDIFFVISGYLLTLIILKELETDGKFSFSNFYERRARRILPTLFFVMLVSLPFAWMYLIPTTFVDFAKSIVSSIFFISNYYFYNLNLGSTYFTTAYEPFLHTWSLSVEEQFYIFFPIIIFFCFKFLKNYLTTILITGLLISLLLADLGGKIHDSYYSSLVFYNPITRFFEFLAGSLLARLEFNSSRSDNKFLNQTMPIIGLFLIFFSFIFFYGGIAPNQWNIQSINQWNIPMPNPSFYTLVAVVGTMLLIWFSKKGELVTDILSSKLFVGLGLISYSLYLWHYPLIIFGEMFYSINLLERLTIIILTIIISILSYRYIEQPFRNKKKISKKKFLSIISLFLIMITLFSLAIIKTKGFPSRFNTYQKFTLDNKFYAKKVESEIIKDIPIFTKSNKKKILIIGDSLGRDLFFSLIANRDLFENYEFSFYLARIECLPMFIEKKVDCHGVNESSIIVENYKNANILLLSSNWNKYNRQIKYKINSIIKKEKKIVIVSRPPTFSHGGIYTIVDEFVLRNNRLPNKLEKIKIKRDYFNEIDKTTYAKNRELKVISNELKIGYLDRFDYSCNLNRKECDFFTENEEKIYFDYGHYTLEGAKYFGKKIYEMNWLKF